MKPLNEQYADLQDEGVLMILRLVDLTLKIGPPQSSRIFQPLILRSMQAVYEGQAYPMLMSVHLSIVSRMILSYKPEFHEFLNLLANNNGNQSDDIAAQILDVWMDKMPCVTQVSRFFKNNFKMCFYIGIQFMLYLFHSPNVENYFHWH